MAGDSKFRQDDRAAPVSFETGFETSSVMSSQSGGQLGRVVRFVYPESTGAAFVPTWEGWDDPAVSFAVDAVGPLDSASGGSHPADGRVASDSPDADSGLPDSDSDMARLRGEERERAFEAGFEAGRQQGIEEGREAAGAEAQAQAQAQGQIQAQAQARAEERRIAQMTSALESFAAERDRYLKTVECEVVKLALAVAARVLRREAEVDPLLLSGAVRVALGQIAAATEVKLRVPAAELAMWKETMAAVPNLAARPMVVAGEGMQLGECAIETALGKANLGIGAQLAEVERTFEPLFNRHSASTHSDGAAVAGASSCTAEKAERPGRESAA